jgi:hypothetical protein
VAGTLSHRALADFRAGNECAHYHHERNHQGLQNPLIAGAPATGTVIGRIRRRSRLGGLLNYYDRAA